MSLRVTARGWLVLTIVGFPLLMAGCSKDTAPGNTTTSFMQAVWEGSSGSAVTVGAFEIWAHPGGPPVAGARSDRLRQWSRQWSDDSFILTAVWGAADNDVFAAGSTNGEGRILHWDGYRWTTQLRTSPMGFFGLWGSSGHDVYAVGLYGGVMHYDGHAWTSLPGLGGGWGVWGSSDHDVYVVGGRAIGDSIQHFDGTSWARIAIPSGLGGGTAVWGSSARDVFVVGGERIAHFDGSTWTLQPGTIDGNFFAVWGSGPSDVFAGGINGRMVHYDGHAWSPMASAHWRHVYGLSGRASNDVYAVGAQGVQHWDGTAWTRVLDSSVQ